MPHNNPHANRRRSTTRDAWVEPAHHAGHGVTDSERSEKEKKRLALHCTVQPTGVWPRAGPAKMHRRQGEA